MGLKHAVDKSDHVPPQFRQGFDVDITQVLKNLTTISSAAESLAYVLSRKSDECESLRNMHSSHTMGYDETRAQLEAERSQIRAERERIHKFEADMKAEKEKDERVIKVCRSPLRCNQYRMTDDVICRPSKNKSPASVTCGCKSAKTPRKRL